MTTPAVTLVAMLAVLPIVILVEGDPPSCPRLDPPIEVWASTFDAAVAKARTRAEKRGATHLYVIFTEPRGGYQYLRAGALRCEREGK